MDTYTQDEEYCGIVIITRKREIDEFESNKHTQDIDNSLRGYPTFYKMMHAKKFIDGIRKYRLDDMATKRA